jgi:tRNA pseudouridine38-40 synthase
MFQKFKLVIEYDGTDYHGWQRQQDEPTIQKALEDALRRMTNQDVSVIGSGRTDSGVHAQNQVAHFAADTTLTGDAFLKGLNSLTPGDIVIKACQSVADSFHARYGVSSKIYDYHIFNHPTPTALFRRHTWHVRKRLDLAAIQAAMAYLEGTHDFSAFEATGSETSHSVRTIFSAGVVTQGAGKFVIVSIEGSGFLRCMVRNLVGTLVDVGLEKTSPQAFCDILKSRDRSKAGATAPARGLFLRTVKYGADTPGMEPLAISSRVL